MATGAITVRHEIHLTDDAKLFLHELARPLIRGLNRLEQHMSEISDAQAAEGASIDAISAQLADTAADVAALLAKASGAGVFSAEEQALADANAAKLAALSDALLNLDTTVGDQDGSDTPPAA